MMVAQSRRVHGVGEECAVRFYYPDRRAVARSTALQAVPLARYAGEDLRAAQAWPASDDSIAS